MGPRRMGVVLLLFFVHQTVFSQYTLNGNATKDACNEYTLTQAVNWLGGSVWNDNKINLTQSFDFNFDVFLGNTDAGADGIAFVLQPISTSVGTAGGGLGYSGITPAVGITIDTWQNAGDNDPADDHIAIQLNGSLDHNNINNIAGPVSALPGNSNIEDGKWYAFRVVWSPVTKILDAYVNGILRVSVSRDFVNDVFAGDPLVFWGFTGSTGGANNLQKFRTALNPAYRLAIGQKRCINEPIQFFDSTVSFTPVIKMYWNFGDGSPVDSINQNPVHTYLAGGDYTVTQKVIGADGCEATNTQVLRIGTKPIAGFGVSDLLCEGVAINLSDSSKATVGIITNWTWTENGSVWSNLQNPSKNFNSGLHTVTLIAGSDAGCTSDPFEKSFTVQPGPDIAFNFADACVNQPVDFSATDNSGSVIGWNWTFGDGGISMMKDTQYIYTTGGIFPVQLTATAVNGCRTVLQNNIVIMATNANAGNDTSVASGQSLQLQASGGINYTWSPATGLNNPFIANPVLMLSGSQTVTYTVRAYTATGCDSFDDITIQVIQAPEIYLPTAFTPDGNGLNDSYKASLVGIKEFKFLRIYNRYGQLVFSSAEAGMGWDGTYQGRKQNSGVYVVIARGKDFRGLDIERKSTLILIR